MQHWPGAIALGKRTSRAAPGNGERPCGFLVVEKYLLRKTIFRLIILSPIFYSFGGFEI
jgi:hypothetical protein